VKNSNVHLSASAALAATGLLLLNPALAQNAPATAANESETEEQLQTVIVTGTSEARTSLTTPVVATSISAQKLQLLSSNSVADVLASIPDIKAEGGGGEVAANIFVAGLPSGGQYQFTPLEFNGTPVIANMGLNSSAPDVYYRPDLGVERLEFVHGGVSNLFGGGGIGGVINFIDKTGTDTPEGTAQLEVSDQSRVRADFAASGPLANSFYYALSGFYRYDNGPLSTGFPTEGYQIRGNLKKVFDSGEMKFFFQAIDDKVQFYGDWPLTSVDNGLAHGNNGNPVTTTETAALDNISFPTPNGIYHTKVANGVETQGGSFGLDFRKSLGDDWAFNTHWNIGNYHHTFALFSGGDGITNLPTTQAAFMQSYGYNPALYTGTFTYANSGAAYPSNYLLWGDRVTDRNRPLTTVSGELNVTKDLSIANWQHHFTLGGFYGYTDAKDFDITSAYIGDFDNSPQLVDVTVSNNATGAKTILSQNGLIGENGYTNFSATARRYAGYLADQMNVGRWEFDIGGRFESLNGFVSKELTATTPVSTNPQLSSRLANDVWGNGQFLSGTVNPTAWAVASEALYRVTDSVSVFLNASRGFFMPQLNSVQIASNDEVQPFEAEIIKQVQGGLKFALSRFSGSVAPFFSTVSNIRNVNFINSPIPGTAPEIVVNLVSTRSYGLEGTFNARLTDYLTFEGNTTFEHDRFTQYTPVAACLDCVGNTFARQPAFMANAGIYYHQRSYDAALYDTYTGRTYTSDLDNIKLPGYHIVRLDAGYTQEFKGGDTVRLSIGVYNLFDSQAVTEGNPRQGTLQNAGQAYFVGREILPRRAYGRVTYSY
jgi:iron complex outermembrane recepter protein